MPTLPCPAKINLFLEVMRKRPDGYHDIESVFCQVPMADTLSAELAEGGDISMECSDPAIPADGRNLVVRAAAALQQRCGTGKGLRFRLGKTIPAGSGLGGGSSNAAAALRLANSLWNANLRDSELLRLAAGIGADVAFFLHGGVCLCQGIGEIITPLACRLPATARLGLFLPPIHSDTAAAYRNLRLPEPGKHRPAGRFIEAMQSGEVESIEHEAFNRFEESVFACLPALAKLRDGLAQRLGRPVRLSGSGSGLWFLLRQGEEIAEDTARWAGGEGARLLALPLNLDRKPGHFS